MRSKGRPSWSKLSIVVYAGALTVIEIVNRKIKDRIIRSKEWFQNSYKEVKALSVTIGKATAELNRRKNGNTRTTPQQVTNIRMLKRKYNVETFVEITSLVERLKIRLQLLRSRISLREADERRVRVRYMPTKMILRDKGEEKSNNTPDVHSVRRYWKSIVGIEKPFNSEDLDLAAWKQSLVLTPEKDDLKESLNQEMWQKVVKKAKPWKAHGPDGTHCFWWKAFKTAGAALYQLARYHLTSGKSLPEAGLPLDESY